MHAAGRAAQIYRARRWGWQESEGVLSWQPLFSLQSRRRGQLPRLGAGGAWGRLGRHHGRWEKGRWGRLEGWLVFSVAFPLAHAHAAGGGRWNTVGLATELQGLLDSM